MDRQQWKTSVNNVITRHWGKLKRELVIKDISDYLIQKRLVTPEYVWRLKDKDVKEPQRTEEYLHEVLDYDQEQYEKFRKVLTIVRRYELFALLEVRGQKVEPKTEDLKNDTDESKDSDEYQSHDMDERKGAVGGDIATESLVGKMSREKFEELKLDLKKDLCNMKDDVKKEMRLNNEHHEQQIHFYEDKVAKLEQNKTDLVQENKLVSENLTKVQKQLKKKGDELEILQNKSATASKISQLQHEVRERVDILEREKKNLEKRIERLNNEMAQIAVVRNKEQQLLQKQIDTHRADKSILTERLNKTKKELEAARGVNRGDQDQRKMKELLDENERLKAELKERDAERERIENSKKELLEKARATKS